MIEYNTNSYYALVWEDVLNSKDELVISGELIHKETKLPDMPELLYGTNPNDITKVRKVNFLEKIEYDVRTTRQSVTNWRDVEEYILSRALRIIVWQGSETLNLPTDSYRVVSPEMFRFIVKSADRNLNTNNLVDVVNKEVKLSDTDKNYREVQNKILDTIKSNEDIKYYEDLYGVKIRARSRSKDINSVLYDDKVIKRADKNWKEKGKAPTQWMSK